jgi:uncharacterized protein (DUF433 family)
MANGWREDVQTRRKLAGMDRIEINSAVCSGKPVIRGTRIMVRNILGMVAGGYSVEKIAESYPELNREDIAAALEYAARVVDEDQAVLR